MATACDCASPASGPAGPVASGMSGDRAACLSFEPEMLQLRERKAFLVSFHRLRTPEISWSLCHLG